MKSQIWNMKSGNRKALNKNVEMGKPKSLTRKSRNRKFVKSWRKLMEKDTNVEID